MATVSVMAAVAMTAEVIVVKTAVMSMAFLLWVVSLATDYFAGWQQRSRVSARPQQLHQPGDVDGVVDLLAHLLGLDQPGGLEHLEVM